MIHQICARRHDAHDFVRTPLDVYRLSNERPSAKRALPQLVRQDRQRRSQRSSPPRSFLLAEEASLRRPNTEGGEQMCVDGDGAHATRAVACREIDFTGGEVRACGRVRANGGKRPIHLPELRILRGRHRPYRQFGVSAGQLHQLIWLRVAERP